MGHDSQHAMTISDYSDDLNCTGDDPAISFNTGITFLFTLLREKNALRELWWVPLISFFPPLNWMALSGWRLDIIRRVGTNQERLVPSANRFGVYLKDGFILWIMTFLYSIPLIILTTIFATGRLENLLTIGLWIYRNFSDPNNVQTFAALMAEIGWGILYKAFLMLLYPIITWPVFFAGMTNYAKTKKIRSFFTIKRNTISFYCHIGTYIQVLLFDCLTKMLAGIIIAMLASTCLLIPLVFVLAIPMYYASTGYFYGKLPTETDDPELVGRRAIPQPPSLQYVATPNRKRTYEIWDVGNGYVLVPQIPEDGCQTHDSLPQHARRVGRVKATSLIVARGILKRKLSGEG